MRILVTGGAGFIGSTLVYQLVVLGGDVLVVDNLSTGSFSNVDPRAEFRKVDITTPEFLEVAREFDPDVIVHLAAQASVAISVKDPDETFRINVEGTRNVVEAVKACPSCERLVFASTAAVYGDPIHVPISEEDPKNPINPYGESKLQAEKIIDEQLRPLHKDFAILRFANVYGPRQGLLGEGGVISAFAQALARDEVPFIEGDGKQTRDFIYVSDIVFGLISTIGGDIDFAGDPETQVDAGRYNLSTGTSTSIMEVGASFRMAAQFFGTYESRPPREGDIQDSVLDFSRARSTFEFLPDVDFNSGVEATYEWFKGEITGVHPGESGEDPSFF